MIFLYARYKEIEQFNKKNLYTYDFNKTLFKDNKEIKYLKFDYNYSNLKKINNKILLNYKLQIKNLTKFYNLKLKKKEDKKYYEIIFGYWLIHYLSQFYFKEHLININKNKYKFIKVLFKKHILPFDTNQFLDLMNEDNYQNYLFSEVLEYKNIKNCITYKSNYVIENTNKRNLFKFFVKKLLIFFMGFFKPTIIIADPYFKNKDLLNRVKLILFSKFKIFFFNFNNFYNFKFKSYKQNNPIPQNFKPIKSKIFMNILLNIPISDKHLVNLILPKLSFYKSIETIVSFNAHYTNSLFKHFLANNNKNVKFFIGQHGSGYFDEKPHIPENFDLSISNKFFYLRENLNKNNKIILPCFINKKIYWKQNTKIFFVTTARHKYFTRPIFTADVRNIFVKDNELLFSFYKYLKFKKKVFFRLHPVKNYSNYSFFSSIKKLNINIDTNYNLYDSLSKARLCVFDHLGTSFYESMHMSIPSIIIINNNSLDYYQKNFLKTFNSLLSVNIIFFSTKKAAYFLNNNYSNLDYWWNSKKVKDVRKDFTNNYSHFSKDWYKNWFEKFNE